MQQVGIEFITRGDKEAEAAIRRLGQSVTGLTQKQIQNGEAGKRLENQRQREVAQTARLEQEYRRLMGAVNPLIGRQNQMREAHAKITQALNREIITRDQAAQSLREYRAALQAGTLAGQGAGKGMNRLGVLAQQSGYQFGDFAVQVQSGTNWMVAFGQQATQLIGTFSMLSKSTKAIAAFSALGVAVPVITAIAGAWMRTREEAEGAEDAFDSLENSLSEISGYSNTARMSLAELREEFGSNAIAIRDNTKALRELATVRALDDLQNTVNGLSESVTKTIDRFAQLESRVRSGTREQIAALAEEVGYTAEQATQLREAFAALGEAEGLPGSIKAAEDLHDVMINVFGSSRDIPPELALAAEQALRAANAGRELEAGMSGAADETGRGASNANSLAGQLAGAAAQARVLVANLGFVPTALAGLAEDVTSQIESMRVANVALTDQIENGTSSRIASLKAERDAILNTMEIEGQNLSLQTESIDRINDQITALEEEEVVYDRLTDTLAEKVKAETASTGSTKASGKAAKEAAKELEKFADEISRLKDAADPTRKFVREMEKLDKLRALEDGLSDGAYAQGVRELNEELVETHPILSDVNDAFGNMVDYMFDGFQDGLKGIWRIFTNTLKNMAAAALKNRITIGIGTAATGAGGAAAAGTPGASFFGGGGNILGALGGFAGDIGLGLSTATGAGSAGLFAVSQNAAVAVAAGAGQFAATIGAALPVIGAVVGAAALLKSAIGTTTKLTNAIEGRFELAGLTGGGEYDMKESDGWFSKGIEKNFEAWEGSWAEDIGRHADEQFQMIAGQMRQSISELGLEVQDFVHDFDFQFQEGSLEPGALYKVVEEEARKAGDAMLKASLAAAGLARDGETGAETLQILLAAINGVNGAAMLLGGTMVEANAITAGAARQFIELAGGLDAFNAKVEGLFTNFLTEAEQITRAEELAQTALDNFSTSLEAMGMVLPETHAEYLALYNAQDLTTEGGRQLAAALLDLQDEFVTVNGSAQDLIDKELAERLKEQAQATEDAAEAARELAAQQREQQGLLLQIARMTGNVNYIREQELAALNAVNRPLQEHIYMLEDQADALQTALDTARDALTIAEGAFDSAVNVLRALVENAEQQLSAAQDALRRAFDAEIDGVRTEYAELIDAVNTTAAEQIDAINAAREEAAEVAQAQAVSVRDQISLLEGMLGSLESALDGRRALTSEGRAMELAQAQAFLGNAVANGGTTDADGLEKALAVVADPSTALFNSFEEYAFDFAVNTNFIKRLRDLTDDALSVEEKTLQELEGQSEIAEKGFAAQIKAIEAARDAQITALEFARDEEIAALNKWLNEVLGIDDSILTVGVAIDGVEAATGLVAAATNALATATGTMTTEVVASLGTIATALENALSAAGAVTDATDAVEDAQGAIDNATGAGAGGIFDNMNSAEKRLYGILNGLAGADGAAMLGAGAFGAFSEDNMNAILSDAGVAALSGLAGDIAGVFQDTLGRNVDVAGLQFYINQIEENGLALSDISADVGGSVEALTKIIPGFSMAVSNAIYGINAAADVSVSAANTSAVAATNSASASATAIEAADQALSAAQAAAASAASASSAASAASAAASTPFISVPAGVEVGSHLSEYFATGNLPSYANGTDFHPGGFARLHENEMVNLPKGTSVSTAGEVREMVDLNRKLVEQNEQMATTLREIRRYSRSRTDIAEEKRAEELAAAAEA